MRCKDFFRQPEPLSSALDSPVPLCSAPEEDVLVAELLLEELGKGLKAGGVIEKLVKIRRPSSNSTNVLFGGTTSCLLLEIGMLQNIIVNRRT